MSGGTVVVLDELQRDELDVLRSGLDGSYRVEVADHDGQSLAGASFIVVRDGVVDTGVLEAAPDLRAVIWLDGSGSVDEKACAQRGIPVHIVPSLSLITVAEHTVLLILALVKRFVQAMEDLRAGVVVGDLQPEVTTQTSYAYNWIGLTGFDALYGKRVGLVGVGKIGREVAIRLRAFGCDVLYTKRSRLDRREEKELGAHFLPLDDLLRTADCVSLHHRFYPETERFIGRREFALMKEGSYFVNTARGRLVDEEALVEALESGRLAGAALDVFWYEPLPPDSPLLRAPNLILTPHVGGIPSHTSSLIKLGDIAELIRSHT